VKAGEAVLEVSRLMAAFPTRSVGAATAEAYTEHLMKLKYPQALHDAVTGLIRTEVYLPTIALVVEEYQRHRHKYLPPAIEEAPITEEERAAAAKKLLALTVHIEHRGEDGHGDEFDKCEHDDCAKARTA
jgi:hypothetical protein